MVADRIAAFSKSLNNLAGFAKPADCSECPRELRLGGDMIARLAPASLTKDLGALLAFATASHARAVAFWS